MTISFCTARAPYKHPPQVGDSRASTRSLSLSALNCRRKGSMESFSAVTRRAAFLEDSPPRFDAQPTPNRHANRTSAAAAEDHRAGTHSHSFRWSRVFVTKLACTRDRRFPIDARSSTHEKQSFQAFSATGSEDSKAVFMPQPTTHRRNIHARRKLSRAPQFGDPPFPGRQAVVSQLTGTWL